ncbi:MAG: hypothetical protein U0168_21110 [Nannocystaceae bacterium]
MAPALALRSCEAGDERCSPAPVEHARAVARTLALLRAFAFADHRRDVEAIRARGVPALVAWADDDPSWSPRSCRSSATPPARGCAWASRTGATTCRRRWRAELAEGIAGLLGA